MKAAASAWPISRRWTRWPTRTRSQHYREVFASLRAHGLEPLVTVNHFTLAGVGARSDHDAGAGPARVARARRRMAVADTPVEFEKYAAYVAWKYGDQVDNWAAHQRAVLAGAYRVPGDPGRRPRTGRPASSGPTSPRRSWSTRPRAYVAAYDAMHTWDTTVATDGPAGGLRRLHQQHDPGPPGQPGQSAGRAGRRRLERLLQPLVPERGDRRVGGRQPRRHQDRRRDPSRDEATRSTSWACSTTGRNPCRASASHPSRDSRSCRAFRCGARPSQPTCSDFNQPTDPGGFREVLEIAASYKLANGTQVPIWITENGIADAERHEAAVATSSTTSRWCRTWSPTAWTSAATPTGRSSTTSNGRRL